MTNGYTMDRAMAEASRCLLCHEPPCSTGCPSGTDPGKFIRQLRLRNVKGAIATVRRNNVLGGVCGALCPTAQLCQKACSASGIDRPIDIGGLQRFLVELGWQMGFKPLKPAPANGIRAAVVGAGPSGLACAAALALDGFAVTVYDRLSAPGGIPRHVIPEHRYQGEVLPREIEDIAALGVTFVGDHPVESSEDLAALFEDGFAGIFLATGAWESVRLGLPGGDGEGVWDAMTFLARSRAERTAMEQVVAGREVAVIGGGDTAMDAAVTALQFGAREVYLLYRRSFGQMPGDEGEKLDALRAGVHFVVLTQPLQYQRQDGRLSAVKVQRNRLGEPDTSGRQRPVAIPGSEHTVPAEVVIEAIGQRPPRTLERLGQIEIDGAGRVVVQADSGATSAGRVYAGGDVVRGPALVVEAVADGKRAAAAMAHAMRGEVSP
jgi:glutamate synthase (NADPH) small chain